jgi:hypothetical protein
VHGYVLFHGHRSAGNDHVARGKSIGLSNPGANNVSSLFNQTIQITLGKSTGPIGQEGPGLQIQGRK